MLENYSARRGVIVPVISFVTRSLIAGPKDQFTKQIEQELGIRLQSKVSVKVNDRPHIIIKEGPEAHVERAMQLITELDQNAQIIANTHILARTGDVKKLHYGLLQQHLLPALERARSDLKLPPKAAVIKQEQAPATPANDQEHLGIPEKPAPRPKQRKQLTIKFHDAVFQPRNQSSAIAYLACRDLNNSYVFEAGPFGGGKTYTPVRAALEGYNEGRYAEIILIRPSATTGKDPGAMPGDPRRKMDPYLKGGLASNIAKMTMTTMQELESKKVIRAFTPDFERGETYDNAFILVDEPQNLTAEQAELLVGRLGENSIMVFAGDIGGKQNDMKGQMSGLVHLIATQASATFTDKVLRDHTAYIKFVDGDSAARNKILPHVSAALNSPPAEYASLMQAFAETAPNPARARALEAMRTFAVEALEKAALGTHNRYVNAARTMFPSLYSEISAPVPAHGLKLVNS